MPPFPTSPTPAPDIVAYFKREQKAVLTLVGYSGAGYEHSRHLEEQIMQVLSEFDPAQTIVNIGATAGGIGQAYRWAKALGFRTSGIVSSAVLQRDDAALSPDCDVVFTVEDSAYGGYVNGRLSPVSEVIVSISDLMIAVGGGSVARDELSEMEKRRKSFRRIEAEAWSKAPPAPGQDVPRGSANTRFGETP